jgi:3-phenylpropionate/trans-cinnamate dioxygenase ferredoxin subunit
MPNFVKAARVNEIKRGEPLCVQAGGVEVLLANLRGDIVAVASLCSHEDYPLCDGLLEGDEIECMLHGSRFSLRTGEPNQEPADQPIKTYPVRVEGEDVLVDVEG